MNPNIITSTARSLRPGMNTLPADTERHTVRAGGITALELHPGDEIQLVNPEGMQLGEITAFNQQGKSDMQYLGTTANAKAEGFKHILSGKDASAIKMERTLRFRNISLKDAESTIIFRKDSLDGDSVKFIANEAVTCVVAAPGEPMMVDQTVL